MLLLFYCIKFFFHQKRIVRTLARTHILLCYTKRFFKWIILSWLAPCGDTCTIDVIVGRGGRSFSFRGKSVWIQFNFSFTNIKICFLAFSHRIKSCSIWKFYDIRILIYVSNFVSYRRTLYFLKGENESFDIFRIFRGLRRQNRLHRYASCAIIICRASKILLLL